MTAAARVRRLRSAANLIQGAYNSAFSAGPGYELQPLNPRASYAHVERYYLDLRAKTTRDIERVITGHGEVLSASATTLAQSALGWWERHLDRDAGATAKFLERVDLLLAAAERFNNVLLWTYTVPVRKYGIAGRWHSAMAQGQAASVLVRAYMATGDSRYSDAAIGAARAMTDHGERLGIARRMESGVAYEECPSEPASMILNGWIFALWGLRDVGAGLAQPAFQHAFELGSATLATRVHEYDYGWWSRYSLFPAQAPDLAKPSYHTVHADQLAVMHGLTNRPEFAALAAKWHATDTLVNRGRAVAIKGRAVLKSRRDQTSY